MTTPLESFCGADLARNYSAKSLKAVRAGRK
jgi:hypothetical protein